MRVSLIRIDSDINIALEKVRLWHECKGDDVGYNYGVSADRIYVSVLFTKNRDKAAGYELFGADIGGTGWDIKKKLPEGIDAMKPKINYGFTSRGCIRNCSFCFVPRKEGTLRPTGDIYDLWDGKSKDITLLDNNILALPNHFKLIIDQLRDNNLRVDFNQGLDARIITEDQAKILKSIRHKGMYRFSWDNDYDMEGIFHYIYRYLGTCMVYVFVGKNSSEDYVWHRLNTLKLLGHRPYLMRQEGIDKKWNNVARWVNQFWTFQKYTYNEFCEVDKQYRKEHRYEGTTELF